jgi:hypothetical protein
MRRWNSLATVVGVIAAIGCASARYRHARRPTNCDHQDHDNTVEVTATGVSCKDVYIKKNVNDVVWYSAEGTKLKIIFPDNPFDDLSCRDNECRAYWVSRDVLKETSFEYHGFIDGRPTADPNVIIKP